MNTNKYFVVVVGGEVDLCLALVLDIRLYITYVSLFTNVYIDCTGRLYFTNRDKN